MGIIAIEGMKFYAYHGLLEEERIIGNEFIVDIIIETDFTKAAAKDEISDTIDYSFIYSLVEKEMQVKSKLIEHVGKRVLDSVLNNCTGVIQDMKVKITKIKPPVKGNLDKVSVTLNGRNC
jgi:dihydroneopterin aldolase